MFDLKVNSQIARRAAAEGIILLKNDRILPLKKGSSVGILGNDCLSIIRGGGGSADVNSLYTVSIYEGLNNYVQNGHICLDAGSVDLAKSAKYSLQDLNKLAEGANIFIYTLSRYATEGFDRNLDEATPINDTVGDGELYANLSGTQHNTAYHLTLEELRFLSMVEESKIKNLIIIANIAGLIDFKFIEQFSKIKAVLLVYLPGMEGGNAIADVLTGTQTPSGKLTDTIVKDYSLYPSSSTFNTSKDHTNYDEDIFVGYRYFNTYCPNEILYPFGFGLSYTKFSVERRIFEIAGTHVTIQCNIKNIGDYSGKDVLQVYMQKPGKKIAEPKKILCSFQKTPLLAPDDESETILCFDLADFASFDETGATGYANCLVLENGEYHFFVGTSSEDIISDDIVHLPETICVKQLTKRISSSADNYNFHDKYKCVQRPLYKATLKDVANGKCTFPQFVAQLTDAELVGFAQGQMTDFPRGTSGIGNLEEYGVPNIQTADGPAGLRKSVKTTCMPCATLLASTWNPQIISSVGSAIGEEGVETGVDVLLAPGVNIHRDPLCGRNFEYYSEDPLLSGKCAAAMISGIQKTGLLACIKHFFANNRENYRLSTSSNMSERAAREIYLKPFEIAIKDSNPAFLMTSYNLVNGKKCSTNAQLLRGILRDEWHWEGTVMTDWRNNTKLWQEVCAGNNIKMPMGYPDEADLALKKLYSGELTRELLEENAITILKTIMSSVRFKKGYFGIIHMVLPHGETNIPLMEVLGISSTWLHIGTRENGDNYFYNLAADQRHYPTYFCYKISVEQGGEYKFCCQVNTDAPKTRIFISIDKICPNVIYCEGITSKDAWCKVSCALNIPSGVHKLTIMVVTDPNEDYSFSSDWYNAEDYVAISNICLSRK